MAAAMPALPPVTFANGVTVGPANACCFASSAGWNADTAGAPGSGAGDLWAQGGDASVRWSLGSPSGGHRWDQVRVRTWIPGRHALAWVRYTVTTTGAGGQSVQTFDVAQAPLNGWYMLPATFRVGTPAQRTGTLTVAMTYLRTAAGMANGCEMAAAQMRFEWS
jgi:hypothetical protein